MMRATIWPRAAAAALALLAGGCARPAADGHGHEHANGHGHGHGHGPWTVTAWGERHEIFAEADPLAVGEASTSHTHVTVLDGFAPLAAGKVSAILVDRSGARAEFTQDRPVREGIFSIEITPEIAGTYDLAFRVESAAGTEEIPAGRVQVGPTQESAGRLIEAPAPPDTSRPAAAGGDPVSFLKEQQWRIPFATAWARPGALHPSVTGPARVRPAAGGEAVLTAPLDGVVAPSAGLYVGRDVPRGGTVVELRPRAASGRSHAEIEAEARLAAERLARLEDLHRAEAVSLAEVERARARAATVRAELDAVRGTGRTVPVAAPFAGRIAEVRVTPGEAVNAGTALARLVRPDPLWVEVGLRSDQSASLDGAPAGLVVQRGPDEAPLRFDARAVRLVSRAPEVDRATGLVPAILEVRGAAGLRAGTAVHAEILLAGSRDGIVVPAEAIVDDAGVPVVYVQAGGESFLRREVRVLARQGERALVEGVGPADRIVTRGAAAIRRAAQMSSGAVEGHVH